MKEWLVVISEPAIMAIDFMALIAIAVGSVDCFIRGTWLMLSKPDGHQRRDVWLRYARWLVAALTFQLAADIIETSISTDWESIARVGAVGVIRTFLNYFLERDLEEVRSRQQQNVTGGPYSQ